MGLVLYKLGELEMALENFMCSYQIRQSALGDSHSDVAVNLRNIGTILLTMGNDEVAMNFYEESLRVERNVLGPDHKGTIPTLFYLASLYKKNGEINHAIHYLQEVCSVQLHGHDSTMTTGNDHDNQLTEEINTDVMKTLYKIAKLYLQIGNVSEYVDIMSEVWRRSKRPELDKIHQFTLRQMSSDMLTPQDDTSNSSAADDDDDIDYDDEMWNDSVMINIVASSRVRHSATTTTTTTMPATTANTGVTAFDLYVLSRLHPEHASMA
jgi:tetratricopeptide (TPR) repeat protein